MYGQKNNSTNTLKPSFCTTDINIALPVLPDFPSDVTSSSVPIKLRINFKSPLFLLRTSLILLECVVLLMFCNDESDNYKIPPKQNIILKYVSSIRRYNYRQTHIYIHCVTMIY